MLSPAVVGNFWRFLYEPQIGLFAYAASMVTGIPTSEIRMLGDVSLAPWAIVIVDTRDVDALCDAGSALPGCASIPDDIYEAAEVDLRALRLAAVLVDHGVDGAALHHARRSFSAASRISRCSTW